MEGHHTPPTDLSVSCDYCMIQSLLCSKHLQRKLYVDKVQFLLWIPALYSTYTHQGYMAGKNYLSRGKNYLSRGKNDLSRGEELYVPWEEFFVTSEELFVTWEELFVQEEELFVTWEELFFESLSSTMCCQK